MSPPVVALPRVIELRSQFDKTLLRYVKEEGEVKGFVHFRGEQVGSADAKFEVHSSGNGNGLVHIRSCYNNKFLVLNNDNNWIAAEAEKPEEDQSMRSCTLLRPTSVDGDPKKIRLTNVHLENNICLWQAAAPYYGCVLANYSDPDASSCDVFNVIDWQSLVFLPKYVAFTGDNNLFLRAHWQEDHNYLQFWDPNMEDYPMSVGNEIVETTNVKISDDTIALRNVANNLFCTRLTTEGKEDCLNAGSNTISKWAKFKVSELIISRKIENVNFRLMDARIYGASVVMMDGSSNTNHGSETQEQTFNFSFKDKTSSTWSRNVSMKASVETSFKVGIPEIVEGEVKVGYEVAGEYMWGETKDIEEDRSFTYKVLIPPKTKVTVRLVANPCFSYYTEVKEEYLEDHNFRASGFKRVAEVSPSGEMTLI
ncbi:hypothetical protein POM88_011531 [Heracleum sosnowskyi]|uniref:Agglutinin domain-containing protein n=1 Tax=Heracleum sosnowskyi TaxID=360622 RepID=A0AAD8MWK4_9APIA|nr:hypothetical protein POM88_011531 [Heracleum sosnowskyi]